MSAGKMLDTENLVCTQSHRL